MESRDFIYVDDVVDAIFRGVKCTTAVNEIFNVGSGIATNVIALAMMLSKALNKEPNVLVTGEFRLGDIRHNFADISRISSRLDFRPQFSLKEGLRQFADWVVSEPLPKDQLDRANDELKRRGLMG
jgi:dTDP-L-rhamnose 4-epimerase